MKIENRQAKRLVLICSIHGRYLCMWLEREESSWEHTALHFRERLRDKFQQKKRRRVCGCERKRVKGKKRRMKDFNWRLRRKLIISTKASLFNILLLLLIAGEIDNVSIVNFLRWKKIIDSNRICMMSWRGGQWNGGCHNYF